MNYGSIQCNLLFNSKNRNIKNISTDGKNRSSKNSDLGRDASFPWNKQGRNWKDVYTRGSRSKTFLDLGYMGEEVLSVMELATMENVSAQPRFEVSTGTQQTTTLRREPEKALQ